MPDREKVISHLNDCMEASRRDNTWVFVRKDIVKDALALLKKQEAKWVEYGPTDVCRLIKCSNCGLKFIVGNNISYDEWIEDRKYCRRCGAKMVDKVEGW